MSSQERLASEVGALMLRKRGNAMDAPIATAFAGGFFVFWHAPERKSYALNFREIAPQLAHRDHFLDADGEVSKKKDFFSVLSTGVPGSPGGSRIIATVLQVLLNRIVHGLNLATSVATPRIHSQLWPDSLQFEQGLSPDTVQLLRQRGHALRLSRWMGSANSVELKLNGGSYGVADPRRAQKALLWMNSFKKVVCQVVMKNYCLFVE